MIASDRDEIWAPLGVEDVAKLFASASFPWWIAGGIALELAVGKTLRDHSDIDVLVLRRDQLAVRELLGGWDCWAADPPGKLKAWPRGQALGDSVHDVWCRKSPTDAWGLQLMLDESEGLSWVSRRDGGISATLPELTRVTGDGVPYLAPHVQLYYKAKNPREKDQFDLDAVLRGGIDLDVDWLRNAITRSYGAQHPWLARLPV